MLPASGYGAEEKQSEKAIKWLRWLEKERGVPIQHKGNSVTEKRIGKYRVDGWSPSDGVVYEFQGCYWHGCPACRKNREEKVVGREGRTAGGSLFRHPG